MLYIGAVEGSECWLRPDQVTRMTDAQAALAEDEDREAWLAESMRPASDNTHGRVVRGEPTLRVLRQSTR